MSAAAQESATSIPLTPWLRDFVSLAAIWGASFLFMRLGVVEFGPVPTAAVRVSIGAAFLLPILLYKGQGAALRAAWKRVFLVGLLNSGLPFALLCFALLSITTGLSSILNASVPLFGALVAWLWLRERPDGVRLLGLVMGFVGVAMLAWDQASFKPSASGIAPVWAVLACLAACVCYAMAASYTKRFLAQVPPLVIATGSQIGASLGLALPALWWRPAQLPSVQAWLAVLAVGVVCTGVAYILFYRLVALKGPAHALTVTYLVPVFAVVYGVLFLKETVNAWMLVSAVVIIVGTALSTGLLRPARWAPAPRS